MNFTHQIHNFICIQEMTSELHFNDTDKMELSPQKNKKY